MIIKHKFLSIVLLSCLLIGIFAFFFISKRDENETEITMTLSEYLLASFVAELPEINKNLPYTIDQDTTLISIEHSKGTIISNYVLTMHNHDHFSSIYQESPLYSLLAKQVCTDEVKGMLLDVGAEFLERYQTSQGELIFEISVRNTDCVD